MDLEQRETCSVASTPHLAGSAAAASTSICYHLNKCTVPHPSSYPIISSTSFLVGFTDSSCRCCRSGISDPRTNPKCNSNSGINYSIAIHSDSTLGKPTCRFSEFSPSKSCWSLPITTPSHEFSTFLGFPSFSTDRCKSIRTTRLSS
jgi:hypothetical protein